METRICEDCGKEKDMIEFESGIQPYSGRPTTYRRCRECRNARRRAQNKEYQHYRLYDYGLTVGQYELILKSQNGKCAICQCDSIKLHVDHDHNTHKIRGLLCRSCNT